MAKFRYVFRTFLKRKRPTCFLMSVVVSGVVFKPWHERYCMLLLVLVVYLSTELFLI